MTNTNKNSVVILGTDAAGMRIYLGEVDGGYRQGVARLCNAARFTRAGAARVAKGYAGAVACDQRSAE